MILLVLLVAFLHTGPDQTGNPEEEWVRHPGGRGAVASSAGHNSV